MPASVPQPRRRGASSSSSNSSDWGSGGSNGALSTALPQLPLPWPAGRRSLHCSTACARSAALPQQQQQQEAAAASDTSRGDAASAGAEAAVTLSGMAVKLTGGDPFLLQVELGAAGPLAAYTEGRVRGMYRKVRVVGLLVWG